MAIKLSKEQMDVKVEKLAPGLVDLRKKAIVSLEKCGLQEQEANIALVLDISGSMSSLQTSCCI